MKHIWAPLLAVICWSGNFIGTKLAAGAIEPSAIGFYRCCIAALALTPFFFSSLLKKKTQILKSLPKLAALALLGTTLYQGLSYVAAQETTATNMGIITSFVPLITIGISSLVLRERMSIPAGAGGILSVFGIFVLVSHGNPETIYHNGINPGDKLMLLASASYALYCILLKQWPLPFTLWESLYLQSLCAVILFLPLYLWMPASPVTLHTVPIILYAGIVASVAAPYLWMRGVASLGPSRASVFMNLFPLMTALIAVGILDEKIQNYHVIGGLMILIGVAIAQKRRTYARA